LTKRKVPLNFFRASMNKLHTFFFFFSFIISITIHATHTVILKKRNTTITIISQQSLSIELSDEQLHDITNKKVAVYFKKYSFIQPKPSYKNVKYIPFCKDRHRKDYANLQALLMHSQYKNHIVYLPKSYHHLKNIITNLKLCGFEQQKSDEKQQDKKVKKNYTNPKQITPVQPQKYLPLIDKHPALKWTITGATLATIIIAFGWQYKKMKKY